MQWLIDAKKRDTKLPLIIRAAVELFVKQGIDATTTKQIAEASGVAEGTLYRHFKSKDEMAYTVFLTHLEAFSRELEKAAEPLSQTKDKLRALITCYFTFFETERTLFEYILASEHRELRNYPVTLRQPLHVVMDMMEWGIKAGHVPDQDVTFASAYIIGMVHRVSVFRAFGRIEENLIHHVDRVTDACWRVVGPEARA
jgi:AcrR family transcriptional regulator